MASAGSHVLHMFNNRTKVDIETWTEQKYKSTVDTETRIEQKYRTKVYTETRIEQKFIQTYEQNKS